VAAVVTSVLSRASTSWSASVDAETEHDGLDGALHGASAYGSPGSVAHTG
jgi:hypothetical protein